MTSCCCSGFESAADCQFDRKRVAKELKRYRERGPGPTTRRLLDGILQSGTLGGSVLDIGSGVGSLTFELLDRGASSAVALDASAASVEAARNEASRRGRNGAIEFVQADFVTAARDLPPAGIVALDRVVCCYPSCEALLDAAAAHAERCLAVSYPREVWYVRAAFRLTNEQRRLTGNAFRVFVHPVSLIERTITRTGLKLFSRSESFIWSSDVYVRTT